MIVKFRAILVAILISAVMAAVPVFAASMNDGSYTIKTNTFGGSGTHESDGTYNMYSASQQPSATGISTITGYIMKIGHIFTLFFAGPGPEPLLPIVYVSPTGDDVSGTGTIDDPFRTIQRGLNKVDVSGEVRALTGEYTLSPSDYVRGSMVNWPNKNNILLTSWPVNSATVTIDAQSFGRIISFEAPVTATITGLSMKCGRIAGSGAGIYLQSGSNLWMIDSEIKYCTAEGTYPNGLGAAVYASDPTTRVYALNCNFMGNNTPQYTGGVAFNGTWSVNRCSFIQNMAQQGAVAHQGIWTGDSNIFKGNYASEAAGCFYLSYVTMTNSLFIKNSSDNSAAVFHGGVAHITNCDFVDNDSHSNASIAFDSDFTGKNLVFWGNTCASDLMFPQQSNTTITYSDMQEKGFWSGEGNISFDPLCVSTAEPYNLRLTANSKCINTGTNEGAPAFDIEGIARPFEERVEMGAYEYNLAGAPTVDATYINGFRFINGSIIPSEMDMQVRLTDISGIASFELIVDNSIVFHFTLTSGTTFDGIWQQRIKIPPKAGGKLMRLAEGDAYEHTLLYVITDGIGRTKEILKTALVVTGDIKIMDNPLNYPNPFKPLSGDPNVNKTYIQYTLSDNASVMIIIYDITGHETIRLRYSGGEMGGKAGLNSVVWNGRDVFGKVVGNGMFLYKIVHKNKVIGGGKLVVLDVR